MLQSEFSLCPIDVNFASFYWGHHRNVKIFEYCKMHIYEHQGTR